MSTKRKLIVGAKATNWAAGVPGMIQDWREIAKKAAPAAGAGASGLVPQVRGWIVDNTTADWIMIAIGIVGAVWFMGTCIQWAREKRREALAKMEEIAKEAEAEVGKIEQEAQAQTEEAKQEAVEVKRAERANAAARRLIRKTWNIARDEMDVHPDDVYAIAAHEDVGRVLVEEFHSQHPEAFHEDPQRFDRILFIHWLVAYRRAKLPENPDENSE